MLASHNNPESVNWDRKEDVASMDNPTATLDQRAHTEADGMIPITPVDDRVLYVLDCPQLDLVDGRLIFPEGDLPGLGVRIHTFVSF